MSKVIRNATLRVEVADGGEGDELHVLRDGRLEREHDAASVAADAGKHVERDAGGQLGRLALGDEGRGGAVLEDGLRDGVFLIEILGLAVADGGRAVVDHRQPRGAEGLGLAALLDGVEGGGKGIVAHDVGEGLLEAQADVGAEAGEIDRRARHVGGAAGLPVHAKLLEGGLGDRDETGLDEHLLDRPVEFLDDLLEGAELGAGAGGDDDVPLVVDEVFRSPEELLDRLVDRGRRGRSVADEILHLAVGRDGFPVLVLHPRLVDLGRAELGGHDEALAQAVKAGLLEAALFRVLGIDDPDKVVAHLEMQVHLPRNEVEKLRHGHVAEVDAELALKLRQGTVGDEVDSGIFADGEDDGLEGDVIHLQRHRLLQAFLHQPGACSVRPTMGAVRSMVRP